MDDTYKVYRCVEGVHRQNIGGEWATLREAYEHAQQEAANTTARNVHYRIHGPYPNLTPRQPGEGKARRAWFVLDDEIPTPPDAVKAREALAKLDAAPEETVLRVSSTAANDPKRRWGVARVKRVYYRVDLVVNGVYQTVRDGFTTERDAQEFMKRSKRSRRDPNAELVIVATSTRPQSGQRKRWGKARKGGRDLSLLWRSDDEMGLGIPAQTGKGRKSRKGEYIP